LHIYILVIDVIDALVILRDLDLTKPEKNLKDTAFGRATVPLKNS
jgi:hypothetical protein